MPESAHALAIYGMAVYYLGDTGLKEALSVLQEALRMNPGCVEAATSLVMIYEAKGQYQEAIQMYVHTLNYSIVSCVQGSFSLAVACLFVPVWISKMTTKQWTRCM